MGQAAVRTDLVPQRPARNRQLPALKLLRLLVHEASQPLTLLLGETELALRTEIGEAELKAAVKRCSHELEHLGRLMEDIRVLGEMSDATFSNTPLVELLEEVLDTYRAAADRKGCVMARRFSTAARIRTDPELMRRALAAVVERAITSCAAGNAVEACLERSRETVALSFSYAEEDYRQERFEQAGVTNRSACSEHPRPDWMIAESIVQVLGGELHVHRSDPPAARVRILIALPLGAKSPLGQLKCGDERPMRGVSPFSH